MHDVLHVDIDGSVATVWLNRPQVRNALSALLIGGLRETIASLDASADVGAIVLTGVDPAFCAGLDLSEVASGSGGGGGAGLPIPADLGTPVIGAINGPAVTGGLELALMCDFLIASERASFADTHARVGILPGWGLTVELPRSIGVRRARQMSFTGNYVAADQALEWGLVNEVVPHGSLVGRAQAVAADVVGIDSGTIAAMKRLYWATSSVAPGEAYTVEREVNRSWMDRGGFDRASFVARRADIEARGSSQL
ncbi:MAG: enoyl-CoA hydratase [Acidimicrobiales bacterium]|nr:enoyl-CoA hydratase [Acidimicrobiales bacterium]MDG1878486.1 enoyl-CoA hydratase [Acidimicrobiales bacterium]